MWMTWATWLPQDLSEGVTNVLWHTCHKCVNSLPLKIFSLFNVSLFWDIRGYEDLRQMVENLTPYLSCGVSVQSLMCNCICNPLWDWMLKAKDSKCKLDEEHCGESCISKAKREAWELKLENGAIIQRFKDIQKLHDIGPFLFVSVGWISVAL